MRKPRHLVAKNKLQVWEFPPKSGIKIRPRLNNVKKDGNITYSYRVSIPTKLSGKRAIEYKQFKEKTDAEKWAAQEFKKYKNFGTASQQLTSQQRIEAAEVFETIVDKGLELRSVVDHYLELKAKCESNGLELDSAIDFAIPRLNPSGGSKTFSEVADELLAIKKSYNLADTSIRDFTYRSNTAKKVFGSEEIHLIEIDPIKDWLASMNLQPRTKKNYLMVVREIFKFAKQKGYLVDNPLDSLTRYDSKSIHGLENGDIREPNILTVDEAKRLLVAAKEHLELEMLAAVTLGLFCGIRTEELKKLEWNAVHLDVEKPFVVISPHIAKKRRIRNVDIPANAISWLKKCPNRKGSIAGNKYISHYQKRFRELQKLSGFGEWREIPQVEGEELKLEWFSTWKENSIRHSFGSYHFALHGDSMLTSRLMGHKDSDVVLFDHYRALVSEAKAKDYFCIQPQ